VRRAGGRARAVTYCSVVRLRGLLHKL
jgi:hypothetical protein